MRTPPNRPEPSEGDLNLDPLRDAWQQALTDAETRHWLELDSRYFLHQSLSTPCLDVLKSCNGTKLVNLSGKTYLDFHGNSVHQAGFNHPRIAAAIRRQLRELSFCTRRYTNIPAVELARELCESLGGEHKLLLAPGGAAAVSMALKLARLVTGRFKTISMWDSFHGAALDTISVGGESLFRAGLGPLLSGCEHVPPPNPENCPLEPSGNCSGCGLRCARYLEYVLEKEGDIGAVVAEPVRCTTGRPPPPGYWERVRDACNRHGALLIFDETAVCLGRTGRLFAHQHFEVEPDILILGKGLGGGILPLAATIARSSYDIAGATALGHFTHEKNPLCCAAGLAVLEVIREERLVERSADLGTRFLEQLQALACRHHCVVGAHGLGLLCGLRLDLPEQASATMYCCLQHGLSFKVSHSNCLTLTPPLTISEPELEHALTILDHCLGAL